MKTQEDVEKKIAELKSELEDLESDLEGQIQDEGIKENSDRWEELQNEFEDKKKLLEKQIVLLQWVIMEI